MIFMDTYKKIRIVLAGITAGPVILLLLYGCAQNPHYVKGRSWERAGQWEEAVAELEEAVRAEPKNTRYARELETAKKTLAEVYYTRGQKILQEPSKNLYQVLSAKSYFQKALENNPQQKGAREGLSQSILLAEPLQKKREEVYLQAKKLEDNGAWPLAREEMKKVLQVDPSYLPAQENLQFIEKILSVETLLQEAKQAEAGGDKVKAKELYRQAAALLPEFIPAQEAYQKLEQEEKDKLVRQRLSFAQLLVKNKMEEQAQKVLEEAQKIDPSSSAVKNNLYMVKMKRADEYVEQGDKLFTAKKFGEASVYYRRALALMPDHQKAVEGLDFSVGGEAQAHYLNARAYQQKGLWGNAAAELKICQYWVPQFRDTQELSAKLWVKIKRNLPPKRGKPASEGLSGIIEQRFLQSAMEWEKAGDKEKAVEDYCRAMAEDSRLNLWAKIFELKDFDPEKIKSILAPDSF